MKKVAIQSGMLIFNKKENVSLNSEQWVTLPKLFSRTVTWVATSSSATNFYLMISADGNTWYTYQKQTSVKSWVGTLDLASPYVALKADAVSGATANLLLFAQ